MRAKIVSQIRQALEFIESDQLPDGSFFSLSSSDKLNFSSAINYRTVFITALILNCLTSLKEEDDALVTVKKKCANFLLQQASEMWTWNYWSRDSQEYRELSYPDDMDDTACALSALQAFNPSIIDGTVMAKVVRILTALETQPGGPYLTWIAKTKKDSPLNDVDLAVNSNIAYFLCGSDVFLPNLTMFIEDAVKRNKIESVYYPDIYPIIYFISRFYSGQQSHTLLSKIPLRSTDSQSLALSVTARLNLGDSSDNVEKGISSLLQEKHWQPVGFCFDPSLGGKKYYCGSGALNAAFHIEAMAKYISSIELKTHIRSESVSDFKVKQLSNEIEKLARERFNVLPLELRQDALSRLDDTVKQDHFSRIILLPYLFVNHQGNLNHISDDKLIKLGLLNLYGWIAYTIYDNVLDHDGDIQALPLANVCLRELSTILLSFSFEKEKINLLTRILDEVDGANTWEQTNCRLRIQQDTFNLRETPNFGDYASLSKRSIGHVICLVCVLFLSNYSASSKEVESIISFFRHYLAGRQLNDDAHDWIEDLKKGQINSVSSLLLRRIDNGTKIINLGTDLKDLQIIFWKEVVDEIFNLVLFQITKARLILQNSFLKDNLFLFGLLSTVEVEINKTIRESHKMRQFLLEYGT